MCRQAALALDAGSSYIYEYDVEADAMVWLAEHQRDPSHTFEEPLGTVYPIEDLPQDLAVVRTRQPVEVRLDDPDLDQVTRRQLLEWGEMSSLMVPLVVGDEVVGSLEVSEAVYPRHFTEQETALCVALGEQAAVAINNAQLYRQLARAEGDHRAAGHHGRSHRALQPPLLLGAPARRGGARAPLRAPLSLLMLDLDDFKRVNDRFGHPVGDELLRAVGRALQTQIRQGVDCAARYGGEEFAVILPATESKPEGGGLDGAVTTAERIRAAIAGLRAPVADPDWQGITVSIGVATLPCTPTLPRTSWRRRTARSTRAKARGKDSVPSRRPDRRGAEPVRACRPGSRTSRPGSRRTRGRSTSSASTRTRRRRRTGPAP